MYATSQLNVTGYYASLFSLSLSHASLTSLEGWCVSRFHYGPVNPRRRSSKKRYRPILITFPDRWSCPPASSYDRRTVPNHHGFPITEDFGSASIRFRPDAYAVTPTLACVIVTCHYSYSRIVARELLRRFSCSYFILSPEADD